MEEILCIKNKLIGLSLFSNVGIAETYIDKYIDMKVANEFLSDRAKFYQEMYPSVNMIEGDILNKDIFNSIIKESKKNNCNFIIATPPCQGMSIAGKRDLNDPRNKLITKVIEAIHLIKPKYFLIENVVSMPKTKIYLDGKYITIRDYLNNELNNNYNYSINFLDTKDYGTPQSRKRAIILGTRKDYNIWEIPKKDNKIITVQEAIGNLPSLESGEKSSIKYHYAPIHNDRHILCMKHTPTGKSAIYNEVYYPKKENGDRIKAFGTSYKRISWNKPSPTITMANGSISSQNNVHPGRLLEDGSYSDARVLSLKEIFILTGLPDDWSPPSWASDGLIRNVIGEGIPPRLIERLVSNIKY